MNFFEKAQARAHALKVLGLSGHPDADEIRATYKKLVFEHHPDRTEGSEDLFHRVQAAYAILRDDTGYSSADLKRQAPGDMGDTSFRTTADPRSTVTPRRVRSAMTSRITELAQADAHECRKLLDQIDDLAAPDPDETSLRASIMDVIKAAEAPFVPHTNHLPFAVRQSGRRISYLVGDYIAVGVNRVAVPTGVFTDSRKVMPAIIRFKSEKEGIGTHVVAPGTLAESFPGAKSVRVHFGHVSWPAPDDAREAATA